MTKMTKISLGETRPPIQFLFIQKAPLWAIVNASANCQLDWTKMWALATDQLLYKVALGKTLFENAADITQSRNMKMPLILHWT